MSLERKQKIRDRDALDESVISQMKKAGIPVYVGSQYSNGFLYRSVIPGVKTRLSLTAEQKERLKPIEQEALKKLRKIDPSLEHDPRFSWVFTE